MSTLDIRFRSRSGSTDFMAQTNLDVKVVVGDYEYRIWSAGDTRNPLSKDDRFALVEIGRIPTVDDFSHGMESAINCIHGFDTY